MQRSGTPDGGLPTRESLLSRLRSWDQQDSWREFFESYWRLIFDAARKAGLDEAAAQDVVQETVIAVARQMPGFRYDPRLGSFKAWLLQIARCRILDAMRRRYRQGEVNRAQLDDVEVEAELERAAREHGGDLERIWDAEWDAHVRSLALERLRRRVRPEQYQMFDLYVLKGWPVARVAQVLGVSRMQVYLSRHRLAPLLQRELERAVGEHPGAP